MLFWFVFCSASQDIEQPVEVSASQNISEESANFVDYQVLQQTKKGKMPPRLPKPSVPHVLPNPSSRRHATLTAKSSKIQSFDDFERVQISNEGICLFIYLVLSCYYKLVSCVLSSMAVISRVMRTMITC